jgi:hypothetical protein
MGTNPFDQFDTPAPNSASGNPFDQFDKQPLPNEGFWPYQRRQLGNTYDDVSKYGGKVLDSAKQGLSSLADLGDAKIWTGENDPNQYGSKLTTDVSQGNWGDVPKDIAGRINEGFSASPPGKLIGGVGAIVGAPVAPAIQEGVQKLEEAGVPHEFSQLALNASPLLAKGMGGDTATAGEAPVSKAYQGVADTALKNGASPEQVMETAGGLKPEGQPAMTLPEALGDPTLLAKQRVLGEQGNKAGADFQEFNNNRLQNDLPASKQGIVEQAGEGNVSTLHDAGTDLQDTAKGIINDAVKARTESVKPQYEAIKNNPIADSDAYSLRANPIIENEYNKVINNDALMERQNKFTPEIPPQLKDLPPAIQQQAMAQLPNAKMVKSTVGGLDPNSIGAWDAVKKNLAAQIDSMAAQGRTQEKLYGLLNEARNNVRDTLSQSEPKYATANDEYAAQSPEITAMQKGPLGTLAKAQTGENAARAFMNMTREQKQQVVPQLKESNPEVMPKIASAVLREATDKTSDRGIGAYIKALSGDKTVRDSMESMLSPEAFEGQKALVETLQKIQKGQPVNSTTQSKLATMEGINNESASGFNIKNVPLTKHGLIGTALDKTQQLVNSIVQKLQEKHQTELMKVFTDPDLEQLGRALKNAKDPQARSNASMGWLAKKLGILSNTSSIVTPAGAANNGDSASNGANSFIGDANASEPVNPIMRDKMMEGFAKAESNNNPNAKNPNSSASGLMQFTNRTWADMVQKYGKQTGITMADKSNPQSQQVMARLYANDNVKEMTPMIGRSPNVTELYMAHVLGAHGAAPIVNAAKTNPNQEALMLASRPAIDANRSLFFHTNKDDPKYRQPRTISEFYNELQRRIS